MERLAAAVRDEGWSGFARVQPEGTNSGFAGGNNAAIRPLLAAATPPDFVMLLNPDTIVRPGALSALLAFVRDRPEIGIAGTRLEFPDGTPQFSAFRFPSLLGEVERGLRLGVATRLLRAHRVAPPPVDQAHRTDWVSGAAMLVRREVFRDAGLLDEGYFLYFEELDFCLQAHRAGWHCWYVPAARVVHFEGQSSGVAGTRKIEKRMPRYWFESRRRYFTKNHGALYKTLADLAWASTYATWRARRPLFGKPDLDPPQLLGDFVKDSLPDLWRLLRGSGGE